MKSKYFKAVCLFGLAVSTCALISITWKYVLYPSERVAVTAMLLMYGFATLGIGLQCGEDDR